jgi:hypothetical protein
MTAPALAMVNAVGKLSIMGILPVAINTLFMRQWLLEVAAEMAFRASYFQVHTFQRECG